MNLHCPTLWRLGCWGGGILVGFGLLGFWVTGFRRVANALWKHGGSKRGI